jgi:LmbE family N-acetylglucosaminyl deacetylase
VAIVAPHPDDETVGAGGVAALHCGAGDDVTIIVVSDGGASRAGGLSADEMAARRHEEVRAAASALRVQRLAWLGLPENRWATADARAPLGRLLSGVDVIYAPSCVDYHPEHLKTAHLLAGLLSPGQMVRVMEIGVPLTPVLANVLADISEAEGQKREALSRFVSQRQTLDALARLARYRSALFGIEHVEVFWELTAEAYGRVMAFGSWERGESPFRGIRSRPFGDWIAFAAGWHMRGRLRTIAGAGGRELPPTG